MDRRENVTALIAKAGEQLEGIEKEYKRSLKKKDIGAGLKIDIKNLFENLRSALDYVAHEIHESCLVTGKKPKIFYFPILPDLTQFASKMTEWYPGLEQSSPELFDLLKEIQPFAEGAAWLGQFNKINNENKHGDLVQQTRVETERIQVSAPGGGQVSWNPSAVKFGSGVRIHGVPVDPRTQLPVPNEVVQTTRTVWVDFRFEGIDVSAIALMRTALKGVKEIADRVYDALSEEEGCA